jgi:protein-disulfide isomerase
MDRFIKAIDRGQYKETVEKDIQEGRQLGINGTPTFFVNGQRLVGARPVNDFVRIIAEQIKVLGDNGRE